MSDILRKSFASIILKADDAKGVVEAIINTTGGEPDHQGDVLVPGAWARANAEVARKNPKVVWSHANGMNQPQLIIVGKVIGARELMPGDATLPPDIKSAGRGAQVARMQFNMDTQAGREAYSNIKGGFVDEWSVGFVPNGDYNDKLGYNEVKSAYPWLEVSPVLMGASPMTATLSAKAATQKARFQMDDGKYPINNCSDVADAWQLRGRSTTHSREQVERHVRHAASELGCNGPWNGKTADLEVALQDAIDSSDLSTATAADAPNGTETTWADGVTRKSTSSRSTDVANEPIQEPGEVRVEPTQYLKLDDARGMFEDIVKAALRDRDPATDPSTRPSLSVEAPAEKDDRSVDELLAKGYFTPAAKGRLPQNFNINKYPQGDIENFSVARAALAQGKAQSGEFGDAWAYFAPWEKQYIAAAKESKMVHPITKTNMGDMVSGQDGGFLAPEQWNQQLYDLLYPSSVLGQVPITRMTVPTRVVHWPILTSGVTVYYVGENAALTSSSVQFRQMTATMRKQAVLAYLSNELIMDSTPQADNTLRQNAAIEMGLDQDAHALAGNATSTVDNGPIGLLGMSGVTSGTTSASSVAYKDLVTGIFNVETLNGSTITRVGQTGCTGIIANPVLKKQIASWTDGNQRPLWDFSLRNVNFSASPTGGAIAPNPGAVLSGFLNVPNWALSNNTNINSTTPLPTTDGSQRIFFGDWRHLIIAERMDIEFMASNVAGNTFANDQTGIRLIRRYDVVCPHPEAFYVLKSVSS